VTFSLVAAGHAASVSYRLDRGLRFFVVASEVVVVAADGGEMSLEAALSQWPPAFFTATLARLQGDQVSGAAPSESFAIDLIEEVEWSSHDVDPLTEKPVVGASQKSLFEWLDARLRSTTAEVLFNDDGAGEAADFVALTHVVGRGTQVDLYHCKAAEKRPIPGKRVTDLYEVIGQAIKCVKMTIPAFAATR
jgi:hypothetical protein